MWHAKHDALFALPRDFLLLARAPAFALGPRSQCCLPFASGAASVGSKGYKCMRKRKRVATTAKR